MKIFSEISGTQSIMWGIILISFAIGIYFYPALPERIASHWGANGEVNGYMSKFWGIFLLPFLSIFLLIFFLLLPKIDPLGANIKKFRKYFDGFIIVFLVFLFYIYVLTLAWNLGVKFNMLLMILPTLGVLFYYLGIMMEKTKRNWFIGIRTPWTISSDNVWNKTHKIGGTLFKISGIIAIIGINFGSFAIFFIIVPIIFSTLYTVIYSYLEYQKEQKK